MARKRRLFEASFKARVALDAVRGMKTVSELAGMFAHLWERHSAASVPDWKAMISRHCRKGVGGQIVEPGEVLVSDDQGEAVFAGLAEDGEQEEFKRH